MLVARRTCSGDVGATVPMAVERRASVLGRSASRGLSAGLCLEFRVEGFGFRGLGFRV